MRPHRRHQMRHQIVRQRSLFRHLAHEHRDRAPDRLIDVYDENFVAIPDENRATATGWEHGANMYLNDRFIHRVDGTDGSAKNKLLCLAAMHSNCSTSLRDAGTFRIAKRLICEHAGLVSIGPMCPI